MAEDFGTRTCRRCGGEQTLDRFQRTPTGRRWVCNSCRSTPTIYGTHRIQTVTAPTRIGPPTLLDLAWVAGVYEGEGSVVYTCGSFRIQIAQKDRWLCDRLRVWFGGSVQVRREKYAGGAYVLHQWYLNGARARGFAYTIYSWLSPRRRRQIEVALGIGCEAVA